MGGWQDFTQKVVDFLAADLLLHDTTTTLTTFATTYAPTLEDGYGALMIATVQPTAATLTVTVTDQSGLMPQWVASKNVVPNVAVSFVPPYPYMPPMTPSVSIVSSVNQAAPGTTWIMGLSGAVPGLQGNVLLRSDGRAYPVGQHSAGLSQGAVGSYTLVAAPGVGNHLLVSHLTLTGGATTAGVSWGVIEGIIGGQTAYLLGGGGSTNQACIASEHISEGILLDANTAVTWQVLTASQQSFIPAVVYDIVN